MIRPVQKRQLTREEYRRELLIQRRRTMRTVRNTLIGIAVVALLWFLLLMAKDKTVREEPAFQTPPAPAADPAPQEGP